MAAFLYLQFHPEPLASYECKAFPASKEEKDSTDCETLSERQDVNDGVFKMKVEGAYSEKYSRQVYCRKRECREGYALFAPEVMHRGVVFCKEAEPAKIPEHVKEKYRNLAADNVKNGLPQNISADKVEGKENKMAS